MINSITSNSEFFFTLLFGTFIIVFVYRQLHDEYKNRKKEKVQRVSKTPNIEKIKILLDEKSIENIDNFINRLINQSIETYMIMNVTTKEHYINSKESEKISEYVYASIMKYHMTQDVKDTIGIIYDISTNEKLENLLKLKIKINILALLVDNNKVIQ